MGPVRGKLAITGFASATEAVDRFEASARAGDTEQLELVTSPIWCAKVATPGNEATVLTREHLLDLVEARKVVRPAYVATAAQVFFYDLSVVRADDFAGGAAIMHLLLRDATDTWRIVGEASVAAASGQRSKHFERELAEAAVLEVLAEYYRAVTAGDPDIIRKIFAPFWEMKNHEDGKIVAESKTAFVERIESGALPGYWDDRQVADIQILYDRLALVRVDRPSTPSTTIFLFMKICGRWKVIDKAWAEG